MFSFLSSTTYSHDHIIRNNAGHHHRHSLHPSRSKRLLFKKLLPFLHCEFLIFKCDVLLFWHEQKENKRFCTSFSRPQII